MIRRHQSQNETVKDIFSKEIKKMTTTGAITEKINVFGTMKGSIFQRIPGTGIINLLGGI